MSLRRPGARSMASAGVGVVATTVGLGALAPALYLGALTVRAGGVRRIAQSDRIATGKVTFDVFVPAHDEESVIAATVQSLITQQYPSESFSVHVVADNCVDRTAAIAASCGATVHVRDAPGDPGKGPALNWLRDRTRDERSDVVVVVDADTIADPGFLAAMESAFLSGASAAQGFYGVLDPEATSAVALRFAALASRHHLRPLGRSVLGASCGLYGNGMAFRADLIAHRDWSGHLVEDAEFQLELLLDGVIVDYVPDAMIAAEMPTTLAGSQSQHERWELGRLQLIGRFVPQLLRRIRDGGSLSRWVYVDAAADQLVPPLTVMVAADVAATSLGVAAILTGRRRQGRWAVATGVGSAALVALHVLFALWHVRAPKSVYRALRSTPRMVMWKLTTLKNIVRRPDAVTWTRTERNAQAAP